MNNILDEWMPAGLNNNLNAISCFTGILDIAGFVHECFSFIINSSCSSPGGDLSGLRGAVSRGLKQ